MAIRVTANANVLVLRLKEEGGKLILRDHPDIPKNGKILLTEAKNALVRGYWGIDSKKLLRRGLQGLDANGDFGPILEDTLNKCRIRYFPIRNALVDDGMRRCWIECPLEWRLQNLHHMDDKWHIWTKP